MLSRRNISSLLTEGPILLLSLFIIGAFLSTYHISYAFAATEPLLTHYKAQTAIKPEDYVRIYNLACTSNRTLRALAEQKLYQDEIEEFKRAYGCLREPTAWRWRYFDENEPLSSDHPKSQILLREKTLNERFANLIYTTMSIKIFDTDGFRFNSGDEQEDWRNMQQAAGEKVDDGLCAEQLKQMIIQMEELKEFNGRINSSSPGEGQQLDEKHIRLARVLDSFGRYESNHLTGRFFNLGSPMQCQHSQLLMNATSTTNAEANTKNHLVNMRFCWAKNNLDPFLDESLRKRTKFNFELEPNLILSGTCFPEACHSKSFKKYPQLFESIIKSEFRLPGSMYANETLPVESVFCLVDDTSPVTKIPLLGRLLLIFLSAYLVLALGVTYLNRRSSRSKVLELSTQQEQAETATLDTNKNGRGSKSTQKETQHSNKTRDPSYLCACLQCFDLKTSWQDFIESGRYKELRSIKQRHAVDLDALNPIKVFACAYVVYGHSIIIWWGIIMNDIQVAQTFEQDSIVLATLAGTTMIDTFFVISGILTAFISLRRMRKFDAANVEQQTNYYDVEQAAVTSQTYDEQQQQQQQQQNSGFVSLQITATTTTADEITPKDKQRQAKQIKHKLAKETDLKPKEFVLRWLFLSLNRYWRIVPLLFIVYWLKRLVLLQMGSGPLWDYGFNRDTPVGACKREPWYVPLTPVSAFYPLTRQCMLQTWTLSNEMVFAFIAPPVILLLRSRAKLALAVISVVGFISMVAGQIELYNIRPELFFEIYELRAYAFTRMINEISYIYTGPQFRIFALVIGLYAGYKLFKFELANQYMVQSEEEQQQQQQQKVKEKQRQKQSILGSNRLLGHIATCWAIITILVTFTIIIQNRILRELLRPYHRILFPLWLNLTRVAWSMANVLLFMRMMTDWKEQPVMRFFSSNFWKIFSKLCFSILLIHFDLFAYLHASGSRTVNLNLLNATVEAAGVYAMCIPLSIALFVLFENPLGKLVNLLLMKRINSS